MSDLKYTIGNSMNNVMIDIESLGCTLDSVIVSIGAVKFNGSGLGDEFYKVCYQGQKDRKMDLSTISWWMGQGEEARDVFVDKKIERVTLREALVELKDFINWKEDTVWSNGTLFDISMLQNAYEWAKIRYPWPYRSVSCLRSIRKIYPYYEEAMDAYRETTSHNALDDAKCQALALIDTSRKFGFNLDH